MAPAASRTGSGSKSRFGFSTIFERDGRRFLRTGDLGRYDEEGYYFMVDRIKRMINAGGYKVWPAEVEEALYAHPAVREVCVIRSPDPRLGETVKAVVVPAGEVSSEEIISWARERFAAYKCPRLVEFVGSSRRAAAARSSGASWRSARSGAPSGDEPLSPRAARRDGLYDVVCRVSGRRSARRSGEAHATP
ncbi:hypothetical protein RxyAA322_15490 [Rubrobacter xylanophilus]|uniref:AMP-binding enzyme C-terminal domain-containing protein n=1 Tax=Rubrobacter xylanophilus TaxID=49319 RepID=A0A510HK84_9ACTN|nr:AMP-binding protein [Rubrobacter xylanophilus]BBL79695.1 hypothetical protein RxyAA322_15490 [Rubrobacter xylanophilus]